MVGKDILRFHAVYWPAFLMAANLPLPKRVFAHGWWTNEGEKISKSVGNVIDPIALIDEFGLDQTRYFLLREVPFGRDGDFSRTAMINRINGDLANDLGNLAQRTLSIIAKNCDGVMPALPQHPTPEDSTLLESADNLLESTRQAFDKQAFHDALRQIWQIISDANKYIDAQAPWELKKTNPARMGEVLAVIMETVRQVAILVQPVMPDSAANLLDQLNIPEAERDFTRVGGNFRPEAGTVIDKPIPVFPRFIEPSDKG